MNRPYWTYDENERICRISTIFHNATVELIDTPNENRTAVWNWEVSTNRGIASEVVAAGEASTDDAAAQAAEQALAAYV